MAGPVLLIELPEPVPDAALADLRRMLFHMSGRFEERRPGAYDLTVCARHLGIVEDETPGAHRPFLVTVHGPGIGEEEWFEAEHLESPDFPAYIGFEPTQSVNVAAMSNGQIDHVANALLTAAIMDVVGGVANVEVDDRHVPAVADLEGLIALVPEHSTAFGTPAFLRAWAAHPEFCLVK
ncbi:DUF6368 family protein [Nonomuraea fastidiosa]|uniref:DUF6368 family protein n=1 Tax=Nonomuraea TaxID=83681 RepID=UPI003254EA73